MLVLKGRGKKQRKSSYVANRAKSIMDAVAKEKRKRARVDDDDVFQPSRVTGNVP